MREIKLSTKVKLRIQPPKLETPLGFSPVPGAPLVQYNDRIYPSRIVRQLGNNVNVSFSLSNERKTANLPRFYIMKDKVSDHVFAQFGRSSRSQKTLWKNQSQNGPDLPAFNVTAQEACRFTNKLGRGEGQGPTPDDRAMG